MYGWSHPAPCLRSQLVPYHGAFHVLTAVGQESIGRAGIGQQQRQRHNNLADACRRFPTEGGGALAAPGLWTNGRIRTPVNPASGVVVVVVAPPAFCAVADRAGDV